MSHALWQLMGTEDPQTLIRKALDRMRDEGYVRIAADYEGGNDSGGVTHARGWSSSGTENELPNPWGSDREYDEDSLWAICDSILGTHFGTWAGEFYANGTIYVVLEPDEHGRTCWREGVYETPSTEQDSGEF